MVSVNIIPALSDNYIYLVAANNKAVLIDPGDAAPALSALAQSGAELQAILITHRHGDHIGGVGEIRRQHPQAAIYAPENCNIADSILCDEGNSLSLLDGALRLSIFATPGHTQEHIVFYGDKLLFCGDTLFACGCGRVFEGSMAQMQKSVSRLAALADGVRVYCGHEYTRSNIAFARAVEPQNTFLQQRAQDVAARLAQNLPTVPFTIGDEKQCNPFMRLGESSVIAAAQARNNNCADDAVSVFTALRLWKDSF